MQFLLREGLGRVYALAAAVAVFLLFAFFRIRSLVVNAIITQFEGLWNGWLSEAEDSGLFGSTLLDVLGSSAEIALHLLVFWIQLKLFKPLILILLSPLLAWLMEKCLAAQGISLPPFTWGGFVRNVWRGIKVALLLTLMEFILVVFCMVLSFIVPLVFPPTGIIVLILPFILSGISAWFYGAAVLDYAWEYRSVSPFDSIRKSWQNRGVTLGIGIPFFALMTIPIISWTIGPVFGAVTSIATAGFVYKEIVEEFD